MGEVERFGEWRMPKSRFAAGKEHRPVRRGTGGVWVVGHFCQGFHDCAGLSGIRKGIVLRQTQLAAVVGKGR